MTVKMAEGFPFDGMDRRWNPSAALSFCVRLSPEERAERGADKNLEKFGKCQEEFRQVKETALQRRRTEPAAGGTGDL